MSTSPIYQIHIAESLSDQWAEWFDPLVIEREASGGTILKGAVRDQAELHGLLTKLGHLNLTLLLVCLERTEEEDKAVRCIPL